MEKKNFINEIDKTYSYVENVMKNEGKDNLKVLLREMQRLRVKVLDNTLVNNPLRGFPRRYAEMYNDYLHPITDALSNIEKAVDAYLESNY